jgi:hypothetical protein
MLQKPQSKYNPRHPEHIFSTAKLTSLCRRRLNIDPPGQFNVGTNN